MNAIFLGFFLWFYIGSLNAQSLEITHPITGEKIKVAAKDFEEKMTWDEAREACKNLGNGWRLPTKEELGEIFATLYLKGKGNFQKHVKLYWSSTVYATSEFDEKSAWCQNFYIDNRYNITEPFATFQTTKCYVRAVRTL